MQQPPIPIPDILSSEIVYRGFFDVRLDQLQAPGCPKKNYTVLELSCDAAIVLAETTDNKLIIVQEYRHPVRRWLLSLPGGRIDLSESPIDAGKRELLEETGYSASEWNELGLYYPFPGVTAQRIHLISAKNAVLSHPTTLETYELIHPVPMSEKELQQKLKQGALADGNLLAALYWRNMSDS